MLAKQVLLPLSHSPRPGTIVFSSSLVGAGGAFVDKWEVDGTWVIESPSRRGRGPQESEL